MIGPVEDGDNLDALYMDRMDAVLVKLCCSGLKHSGRRQRVNRYGPTLCLKEA